MDPETIWAIVALVGTTAAWDAVRRYIRASQARQYERDRLDTYERALSNGLEQLREAVKQVDKKAGQAATVNATMGRRRG